MRFGYIWYTSPAAIICQAAVEHAALEDARDVTSAIDRLIEQHRKELLPLGGAVILHDWRIVRSYDPQARRHLFARSGERPASDVRATVIALTMNPILRMGVEAGNALLRATTGRVVQVVPSIAPSLARYGVVPPKGAGKGT